MLLASANRPNWQENQCIFREVKKLFAELGTFIKNNKIYYLVLILLPHMYFISHCCIYV